MRKSGREKLQQLLEPEMAEQATGCPGVGDYREYAQQRGYPHLKVWDWTSSAGDWAFLVSRDGRRWRFMFQSNNYPRPGFTRTIEENGVEFSAEGEEDLFEQVARYLQARCPTPHRRRGGK